MNFKMLRRLEQPLKHSHPSRLPLGTIPLPRPWRVRTMALSLDHSECPHLFSPSLVTVTQGCVCVLFCFFPILKVIFPHHEGYDWQTQFSCFQSKADSRWLRSIFISQDHFPGSYLVLVSEAQGNVLTLSHFIPC